MKYLRGFLMAWGCFCWIPCPYKKWNEDDRTAMVAMLPLLGTCLGLITAAVLWAGSALGAVPLLVGAIVTAAYFVMTGFIHLDGFMDVADAVMPRHPRMEERVRILKDPHTGSFAAISMALMLLVFAASAAALCQHLLLFTVLLPVVLTISRCCSAVSVICCTPMQTSQYAKASGADGRSFAKALPAVLIALVITAAGAVVLMSAQDAGNGGVLMSMQGAGLVPEMNSSFLLAAAGPREALVLLAAAAVTALCAVILGAVDRKALGGMNGDISGHMITSSEMAGFLAAALLM